MKILTYLMLIGFLYSFALNAQNPVWSLPSHQVDFSPAIPSPSPLPRPQFANWPLEYDGRQAEIAHNSATDAAGNILFFIIDNHLFDINGRLVEILKESQVFEPNGVDYEIIPVPGNCNQYYIIATEVTQANNLVEYFIYDLTATHNPPLPDEAIGALIPTDANGNLHSTLKQSLLWVKGNQGEDNIFFATTPMRSDNNRLLFISSNDYIYCYDVTPNGIFIDEDKSFKFIPDGLAPNNQPFYFPHNSGSRGEMEVVSTSFGYRLIFSAVIQSYNPNVPFDYEGFNSVFVYDLDNNANRIFQNIGGNLVDRKGRYDFKDRLAVSGLPHIIYGLEFANNSPNGFLLNKEGTDIAGNSNQNLYFFNLTLNVSTNEIEFTEDARRHFLNYSKSQIEAGINGNLYLVNATNLIQLVGTYPSISLNATTSGLNYRTVNSGSEQFTLPNQIDNENYLTHYSNTCCFNREIIYNAYNSAATSNTWDGVINPFNSNEIVIKKTLHFPAGANVIIRNMTIRFEEGAKMIIDKGAKVTLDNATLTSKCNNQWEGVFVAGEATISQSTVSAHGQIVLTNSTVENAKKGIRNYHLTNDGNNNVDFAKCGGIIQATNSVFVNNRKDVEFFPYNFQDKSFFTDCQFITNDNIQVGVTNDAHLSLFGVKGIRIKGCEFSNNQTTNVYFQDLGRGITSFDANFILDYSCSSNNKPCPVPDQNRCQFNNLYEGIYAQASNPINSFSAKNADFNSCYKGIFMGAVDYAIVDNNSFELTDELSPSVFPYGIYTINCTGYSIENNDLTDQNGNTTYGIIINNSNNNGFSQDVNYVYRNTFNGVKYASVAMNANVAYKSPFPGIYNTYKRSGLKYKCNEFNNSQDVDIYIQEDGGISPIQGRCFSPGSGANNEFNSINPTIGNLWNSNNYQFLIQYYYNYTPTDDFEVNTYNFTSTSVTDCQGAYTTGFDFCPAFRYKSNTEQGLKDEIDLIAIEIDTKEQYLTDFDNAYVSVWNAKQNGNMSWGDFKNSVKNLAPIVQEDFLIELVNYNAPGGIVKQILLHNTPLSQKTIASLEQSNLSNGIKNNILDAQNSDVQNERESLEDEVEYLKAESTSLVNELIRFYMHDDESKMDLDKLEEFLRSRKDVYYKCQLVNVKIAAKKHTAAQTIIDSLRTVDSGIHSEFCDFREQLIDFETQVSRCYVIKDDPIRKSKLEASANLDINEKSCYAANVLLNQIFKTVYQEEKPYINMSKSMSFENNDTPKFTVDDKIKIYPNPTQGIVTFDIDYTTYTNVQVTVYNVQGKVVQSELISNEVSFIDLNNLENGIYIVKTRLDNDNITSSKIVLRK